MKKQISNALLVTAAALALAFNVNAQGSRAAVVVKVPFDFVAGQKHLPAGSYTVSRVRKEAQSALLIRGEDGRSSAVVLTYAGEGSPRAAALVFRQVGDRYFLAEVSMPGTASVRGLPKSGVERRLERELAGRGKSGDGGSKKVTVVGSVR